MKKIFSVLAVACGLSLSVLLAACGGDGPKGVVDEALCAMKEGNADGLMDCILLDGVLADADSWRDFKDELPEPLAHQKKVAETVSRMLKGMLKDVTWTFGDVELDGGEATVTVKMKRRDESEHELRVNVTKDKHGRWKVKSMGDLM